VAYFRDCTSCGEEFKVDPEKKWALECFACWRQSKIDDGTWKGRNGQPESAFLGGPGLGVDRFRNEFNKEIDALIRLTHPDKHNNSEASNRLTVWLLEQRKIANS